MRCADCPEVPNGTRKRPICCQRLPSACIDAGHFWSGWSLWLPVRPDSVDIRPLSGRPIDVSYKAVRDRRCERCGCIEQQTKDGEIKVVADPSGIEAERKRSAA